MSNNRFQLIEEILKLSVSKHWDEARFEWAIETIEDSEEPEACLCGQFPINELCWLRNQQNGNPALVGNVCVHKFMGIESQKLFDCLRRIQKDETKALNAELTKYAKDKGWINEWEHKFLISTMRQRDLSQKQLAKRIQINRMLIRKVKRTNSPGSARQGPTLDQILDL